MANYSQIYFHEFECFPKIRNKALSQNFCPLVIHEWTDSRIVKVSLGIVCPGVEHGEFSGCIARLSQDHIS